MKLYYRTKTEMAMDFAKQKERQLVNVKPWISRMDIEEIQLPTSVIVNGKTVSVGNLVWQKTPEKLLQAVAGEY